MQEHLLPPILQEEKVAVRRLIIPTSFLAFLFQTVPVALFHPRPCLCILSSVPLSVYATFKVPCQSVLMETLLVGSSRQLFSFHAWQKLLLQILLLKTCSNL